MSRRILRRCERHLRGEAPGADVNRRQSAGALALAIAAACRVACVATVKRRHRGASAARIQPARRRDDAVRTYMGRTIAPPMHFSGAGWLTRARRERRRRPGKLFKALEISTGQTVCDFGCGNGYHTLQLAKRVGPRGMVYAVDIQPEMLDLLAERAAPRGLENIKPVLATVDDQACPQASSTWC